MNKKKEVSSVAKYSYKLTELAMKNCLESQNCLEISPFTGKRF